MESKISTEQSITSTLPAIDAHIHFDRYSAEDQQRLLDEAAQAGVEAVVAVSMDLSSSEATHRLVHKYPSQVTPAYGFHPEQTLPSDEAIQQLFDWINANRREWFAIGEVGLPYYTRQEAEEQGLPFDQSGYIALLRRFMQLAVRLERPIVLHAVYEDADITCDLLEETGLRQAHFHWFKGSAATIQRMIQQRYYISITPDVLYEEEIQELVRIYPLQLMMVETDGPWPFIGLFEHQQTHPRMVIDVIRKIAALKSLTCEETAKSLHNNTIAFYNINNNN